MGYEVAYPKDREDVVFRDLIERRAAIHPDRVFAVFEDGTTWTYAELRAKAVHAARGLASLGVRRGDHVISWLPTGGDAIIAWLGINYLGAVYVPLNTAYRGALLEHVIWLSDAKLAVVHADLLDRLAEVKLHELKQVVAVAGPARPVSGVEVTGFSALTPGSVPRASEQPPPLDNPIEVWEPQSLIFTSGTTGPSKGVLSSYRQLSMTAAFLMHWLTEHDRLLVNLPLFHISGTSITARAISLGASIAVVESFRTSDFWPTVRRLGVTFAVMMGSIATFLAKLPEDDDRRNTPLKSVLLVPLSTETLSFIRRIGVDWYTTFNMSEVAVPLVTERKPTKIGVCGRRRLGAELRIVDEQDNEVPDGTVGQLVLRDAEPWALCSGYYKDYEATAKAWRNGWFHTGDAFRRDAEGDYFYIDRMKDAIRRRGENISSFEVEAVVNEHPDVHESAAIAVPSEHGEDEVMIVVMTVHGRLVNPPDLIEYLIPRMPHYMIPRYIELTDSLPRTPTMKVQKAKLRETGISENTFDREAAGIKLHRHQFCRVGG